MAFQLAFTLILLLSSKAHATIERIRFYFIDAGVSHIQEDEYFLEQQKIYNDLLKQSKYRFDYDFATIPRIDNELAENKKSVCATAFIKTPQRLAAGIQYVLRHQKDIIFHVYQPSTSTQILTKISNLKAYKKEAIHVYGVGAEMELQKQRIEYTRGVYMNLSLKMLLSRRIQFIVAPEHTIEFTSWVRRGEIVKSFDLVSFPSYLVCSKKTPCDLLEKMVSSAKKTGRFIMKDSYKESSINLQYRQ